MHHRFLGADGLDHRVRPEPAGEFLDRGDAAVAALTHDVGGPELQRQILARLVPAHRNDPLRLNVSGYEAAGVRQREQPVTQSGHGGDVDLSGHRLTRRRTTRADGHEPGNMPNGLAISLAAPSSSVRSLSKAGEPQAC